MQTSVKLFAALALAGCCFVAHAQDGKKESKSETKENKMEMKEGKPMMKKHRGGGRHTVRTAARREGQRMKMEEQKMEEKGKM